MGIVGTILNGVALVIIIVWSIFLTAEVVTDPTFQENIQKAVEEAQKKAQENQGNIVVETGEVQVTVPAQPQAPQTPEQ